MEDNPADLRRQLNAAHASLLRVHKTLIDHERDRYARADRPLGSPLEFLNLLLQDPRFAWLRPISELIIQIDEASLPRNPIDVIEASALLAKARELLTPSETPSDAFPYHYYRAIQESAEVAAARVEWERSAQLM